MKYNIPRSVVRSVVTSVVRSSIVTLVLLLTLPSTLIANTSATRANPPAFNGCDAAQQQMLVSLTGYVENQVNNVVSDLRNLPENRRATSPRYDSWFGRYTSERYSRVVNGYSAILSTMTEQTLSFDCTCQQGDLVGSLPWTPIAYVGAEESIFLCPGFFSNLLDNEQPTFEPYSFEVGTIIHEISHFETVIGAQDFYLSGLNARDLSLAAPSLALNNATNYEGFAIDASVEPLDNDGTPLPQRFPPTAPAVLDESSEIIELQLENLVRGFLVESRQSLYSVTGAPFIVLTSIAGNADLYVYSDASFTNEMLVCASVGYSISNRLGLDVCEVDAEQTYYVLVDHYPFGEIDREFADYAIVATATAPGYGLGDPSIGRRLPLSSPIIESMGPATFRTYYALGAATISLQARAGQLNLIVDAASTPFSNQPICQLDVTSTGASSALCEVMPEEEYHIVVSSFSPEYGNEYEYEVLASPPDAPGIPDTPEAPGEDAPALDSSSSGGAVWLWLVLGGGFVALRKRIKNGNSSSR